LASDKSRSRGSGSRRSSDTRRKGAGDEAPLEARRRKSSRASAERKTASRAQQKRKKRKPASPGGSQKPRTEPPPRSSLVAVAESERTFQTIEQALVDLWSVVNELSRVRPPRKKFYRVTIFGSSRMFPGDEVYEDVRRLAAKLSSMGCDIVTGGGPGLMQAANEGAHEGDPDGRTRSYGLAIQLPTEEQPNPFVEKLYRHKTFFSRLHHFVRLSSAFIVVQGGIGTTLEALMTWQLLQVRHIQDTPFVLLGPMWKSLVSWSKRYMLKTDPPMAEADDLALPTCVETVDHVIEVIRQDLERFRMNRTSVVGQ